MYRLVSPVYGLRALAMNLRHHYEKDGQRTVRALVSVYAPPGHRTRDIPQGNDTEEYIREVAAALHVGPDDPVDLLQRPTPLVFMHAIERQECGRGPLADGHWYPSAVYEEALSLAGL